MNGSGNETLSVKQAEQIRDQFEEIVTTAVSKMEESYKKCFKTLEETWADENAVDFADELKNKISEVTGHLDENCEALRGTLEGIANAYRSTGRLSNITINKIKTQLLSVSHSVKHEWGQGESGFKGVDAADKAVHDMEDLVSELKSINEKTNSRLQSINAFGNKKVQNEIAASAGEIFRILDKAVEDLKNSSLETLKQAANAYKQTGESAATAAKIQTVEGK